MERTWPRMVLAILLTTSACGLPDPLDEASAPESATAASSELGGPDEVAATTCGPVVSRFPLTTRHNISWDSGCNAPPNGRTCRLHCMPTAGTVANDANHDGGAQDIFAEPGAPVVAAQNGRVSLTFTDSLGGNVVYIKDGCGYYHYYAHLQSVAVGMYIGRDVTAGTVIGYVGNSGSAASTQHHLHYAIFGSTPLNPYSRLTAVEGSSCWTDGTPPPCLPGQPCLGSGEDAPDVSHPLSIAFAAAAQEFRVPADILKAVSHAETRWIDHGALPSAGNGYGLMHLQENEYNQGLTRAAALLGLRPERLKADRFENLRGGAALLAMFYREAWPDDRDMALAADLGRWFDPVARFRQSPVPEKDEDFADHVFSLLSGGAREDFEDGSVELRAHGELAREQGAFAAVRSRAERLAQEGPSALSSGPDWGADAWDPSPSYTVASRGTGTITKVLIHACGGSYTACYWTFKNAANGKSIHYLVRSDGFVLQMVRDKDIAWHTTGHNGYTVGIEHEGTANVTWWSDTVYRESAWVTAYRLFKYALPANSTTIIGHNEVQATACPGSTWIWSLYRSYAAQFLSSINASCQPGVPC